MNRNMRMLHNENNRLDKTLCEDYQKLMTDIVCYLRGADISELQQEKVRYDLTLMLLEAQQRNAPLDEVFPEDYKAFCDTVIKELPPRSQLEKLRERLQIVFLLIAILGVINLFLSKDGLHALLQLDIQSTYPLSLSTLLLDILLGISAVCIVQWICRSSFENDDKTVKRRLLLLWLFTLCISVGCMLLFQNIIVLRIPIWLFVLFCFSSYLLYLALAFCNCKDVAS